MVIYPPTGKFFQRGEDRCQIDVGSSSANSLRACNDLGYVSAILKQFGFNIFLKDYQALKLNLQELLNDFQCQNPDILFISTTNGSIFDDLKVISEIKKIKKDVSIILKGAIFFNPDKELFKSIDLTDVDYLIGGEVEFIIGDLVKAIYDDKNLLKNIEGISYKENDKWVTNNLYHFHEDIDSLPFPDRSLMPNELYINPMTNKPMALITTDKGCCFNCRYCLSPILSGKKVRNRSVVSIFNEIKDCVNNYNITNFFLKSDTFTVNKQNVIELCNLLIESKLNEKITWVATSRVDTIDEEMLSIMKKSGLKLMSVGFESGSQESLDKMGKNNSIEKNIAVSKLCKKYDIEILGHFLIGFPWEDKSHLEATKKHIFDVDADYIEISIVIPYMKTPIYEEFVVDKVQISDILGFDSYNHIFEKYTKLSPKYMQDFRKHVLLKYYTRPKYIIKKLSEIKNIPVLKNYIHYGLRLLKNTLS